MTHGRIQAAPGQWNACAVPAVLVLLTAFYMIGAGRMVLSEPDEARCALIAREMLATGDWVVPHLLNEPYFNKPPLYFWVLAGSMKLFGQSEWALRLPSALIAAGMVVLTGQLAGQLFGRRAAWLAGATFAVCVGSIMASRVVRMDMLLALWIMAALLCWSRAHLLGRSRNWYIAMYVCMALGCLTKGPIAVLLPGLIIGLHVASGRQWRSLRDMHIPLGALIVIAIFGTWVILMTARHPEYPRAFFWGQNLDRFAGSGADASEQVLGRLTVLGSFAGALLPWTALVGLASWRLRPRRGIPPAERFLWTWGLAVLVFFSLSKGQLPNYVLPALPSTFALLGAYLAPSDGSRRERTWGVGLTFALAAIVLGIWPIAEQLRFGSTDYRVTLLRLGSLIVLAVLTVRLWRRGPVAALMPMLLGCAVFSTDVALGSGREYLLSRCSAPLAEPLHNLPPTAEPVIITPVARFGVAYYAPPGWHFRHIDIRRLAELLPLLDGDHPFYAVLTGDRLVEILTSDGGIGLPDGRQVNLQGRVTVLARHRGDSLVRIMPARSVAASPATRGAEGR